MKRSIMKDMISTMTLDEIVDMVYIDPVSCIPNRRAFDTEKYKHVAIIDMDSLKWINDNRGHAVGDECLRILGSALHDAFPSKAYHLSGDEFAVVGDGGERLVDGLLELRSTMNSFSFGVGSNLKIADFELQYDKDHREKNGERSSRGEAPRWGFIQETVNRRTQSG